MTWHPDPNSYLSQLYLWLISYIRLLPWLTSHWLNCNMEFLLCLWAPDLNSQFITTSSLPPLWLCQQIQMKHRIPLTLEQGQAYTRCFKSITTWVQSDILGNSLILATTDLILRLLRDIPILLRDIPILLSSILTTICGFQVIAKK